MPVRRVRLSRHLVPGRDVAGPAMNDQAGFGFKQGFILFDAFLILHVVGILHLGSPATKRQF